MYECIQFLSRTPRRTGYAALYAKTKSKLVNKANNIVPAEFILYLSLSLCSPVRAYFCNFGVGFRYLYNNESRFWAKHLKHFGQIYLHYVLPFD
jgi:hypothetical protein